MLANIQGTSIFYEVVGDGLPLVFVHGLGGTSNVWQAQRAGLAKYFKVVTLDLPGSGRSDNAPAASGDNRYSNAAWINGPVSDIEMLASGVCG